MLCLFFDTAKIEKYFLTRKNDVKWACFFRCSTYWESPLGNYLGAIKIGSGCRRIMKPFIVLLFTCYHSATRTKVFIAATHEVAACLIASGIEVNNSILFNQSQVPQHAELAWLFNCVARLGWLNRMTQFKEKAGKKCYSRIICIPNINGG